MQRRAEMGVGTLIIFISLLLVAAVAAGVIIQSAGSLQQRALSTGSQATGQISTNAMALEVSATDGLDGSIEDFEVIMRLAPGSDPIKLDDVTFMFSTVSDSQTLTYSEGSYNTTRFNASFVQTGQDHRNHTLTRGDVMRLQFNVSTPVNEEQDVRLNFIPKIGSSTEVQFTVPDVVSTQRVYLYP